MDKEKQDKIERELAKELNDTLIQAKKEMEIWHNRYKIGFEDGKILGITEGKKLMIDEVLKIVDDFDDYPEELGNYLMPKLRELKQKLNKLKEQER